MSHITFDDVTVRYATERDDPALRNVSLGIDRGEVVGVTGPAEAGKSTLLRTIASYVPNYFNCDLDGTVTVSGVDVSIVSIGEHSRTVGMLFENPFDQLTGATTTVVEEVAYGLENQGLPREEIMDRTYASLERVGIADLMARNPYDLSGGQSQRVALAAILALEPEVLLLDEPTSQLDPSGTAEVFDVIESMSRGQYTTVIVSQDVDRLAPLVDRLVVLDDGKVRANDAPATVLAGPLADEGLFAAPEVVQLAMRLRASGRLDADAPLPLDLDALLGATTLEPAGVGLPDGAPDGATDPSGESTVVFEDVWFSYGDIDALRGLSFRIGPGCTCLIGQNGAGKSTAVKHLNGLLTPDAGRVLIEGRDTRTARVAQLAHTVGLSFQNPDDQLFHSSVRKEVSYGPRNLGYDEERVEALTQAALERFDLKAVADKHPYDLGLARRKRVAVASVLAMDTDIVVLDEPTGGQDRRGVALLGDVIGSLVDAGKTVITVTHDIGFARDHADRIIALRGGELLLEGPPRTVFGQADILAETHVQPPVATALGLELGLDGPPLTVEELVAGLA